MSKGCIFSGSREKGEKSEVIHHLLYNSFAWGPHACYLQEIVFAFTGVLNAEGMKEEGNRVVLRGREGHCAVQVVVIITGPARTLQVAKRLVVVSVTVLKKAILTTNVCLPIFSVTSV